MKKVIKFSAEYCAPCRAMAPIFDEISKDEKFSDAEFQTIDVTTDDDHEADLIAKFKIRAIPTVVITNENEDVICSQSGFQSRERLEEFITNGLSKEA